MTRTAGGSVARAAAYCAVETPMMTGSKRAIADATAANAPCAGCARMRQLSGRSGQSIQQHRCGASSAGIAKPSRAGVEVRVLAMKQIVATVTNAAARYTVTGAR